MDDTPDFATQLAINTAAGSSYADDMQTAPEPAEIPLRFVAFYLPQFHPIPENDLWWGKGFTEWTNVTKARPQFPGHYQPQLPSDLSFYDLRLPDTLRQQAVLARKYGIHGFCFHYYWFGGKQLLETPLNLLLSHPDIDLPFCICWANENWTRRWDGLENELLITQQHSPEDDIAFARSLETALRDPRYIRVNGRPLILLYRPMLLPNALATARRWRVHFARSGLGNPYLVMAQAFNDHDPRIYGFDAAVEIPPHKVGFGGPKINSEITFFNPAYQGTIYDYEEMVRRASASPSPPYKLFRGVCPGWDNEPRKPGCGHVFAFSTPEKYAHWLEMACRDALSADHPSERLVFINAWNEWAEGAHLEPDRHFGHAYLQATARVLAKLDLRRSAMPRPRVVVVSHDAHLHGAQMIALHIVRALVQDFAADVRVLLGGPGQLEQAFRQAASTQRIDSGFADATAWHRIARRLRTEGFMFAWCNSLVSAQVIEPLRDAGLHVVSLIHELPDLIRSYGLLNAARAVAQQADAVVFPSAYVRDRFVELAGPVTQHCFICPQGLYLVPASEADRCTQRSVTREFLNARPADRIILGVGYGDRRKGIDLWPELIRLVVARCPEALFVWVGRVEDDLLAGIKAELEGEDLTRRFRLPGPSETMQHMYAAADLFALTSREDPFPSVVLEAMAHGLPVVAFENSGGFTGLLRETSASLAPYLDIKAMADELCRLLRDERARDEIGKKGRQRIERDFNFNAYVSDLLHIACNVQPTISVVVPNYNYARRRGADLHAAGAAHQDR
jgi:glycosyltransferase involved in cell wall biosynthesis